jgi:hypothetical protein
MAVLPTWYHDIVMKIMVLMGIYRDNSPCLYCDAISAKTRRKNYLVGTIDCITRVVVPLCASRAARGGANYRAGIRALRKSHCSHLADVAGIIAETVIAKNGAKRLSSTWIYDALVI